MLLETPDTVDGYLPSLTLEKHLLPFFSLLLRQSTNLMVPVAEKIFPYGRVEETG